MGRELAGLRKNFDVPEADAEKAVSHEQRESVSTAVDDAEKGPAKEHKEDANPS